MARKAYLLTDSEARALRTLARVSVEAQYGGVSLHARDTREALAVAAMSLTRPIAGIVPQAEHEYARLYLDK